MNDNYLQQILSILACNLFLLSLRCRFLNETIKNSFNMKSQTLFEAALVSVGRAGSVLSIVSVIFLGGGQAKAVDLIGNFRLYGEVNRFGGLGWGDLALNFGVNTVPTQIGSLGYFIGGIPFSTGVLSSVSLPGNGFAIVDEHFSLPFSLDLDQPSSLYMGIGDNGNNGYSSGNVQVIFDFSDNQYYGGSIIEYARDQGFGLTSVTLPDGTSLLDAGLELNFIPENTLLTAAASAYDNQGAFLTIDTQTPQSNSCGRAFVILSGASASSKLRDGFDFCGSGVTTDSLIDLDVLAEPNLFVFDVAYSTVSGFNNIILTRNGLIPPDAPGVPGPLPWLGAGVAFGYSRKLRRRITSNKLPEMSIG